MPKHTFNNLKKEKKEIFLKEALEEFSLKGYYGASLTQLVKKLQMAKGSLYQYFDDKDEMYAFLIAEACSRRLPFFNALDGKPREDYSFNYLIISLKFDVTYPYIASLFYNGFTSFRPEIITIINEKFLNLVPQNYLVPQIPLLALATANFIDLVSSKGIDLGEIILSKSSISANSSEILQIIQKNNLLL
jgi:AcrR family transcriptional regulator